MRTFLIATSTGAQEASGTVAILKVGGRKHRFVIHGNVLSDYRSGYRVCSLDPIKVERMARLSTYHKTSDRQAAQIMLDRIVAKIGLEKVQSALAAFPTINA